MDYYKTRVDESLRRLGLLPLAANVWQVIQESGHSLFFTRPVCQETKYYIAKTNHIPYMDIKELMCCYNSRHPYLKAFHKILQAGFRNLAPVSHKSFSKISHWCWVMRLGLQMIFQVIPKSVGMLWGQGSTEASQVLTPNWGSFSFLALLCWNGTSIDHCCHKVGNTLLRFALNWTKGGNYLTPEVHKQLDFFFIWRVFTTKKTGW